MAARESITHVVIIDGTLSTLERGLESNAGLTFRLLDEIAAPARLSLRYEEGIQLLSWRSLMDVIAGSSITWQIRRAYGFLAARYRPGDRIFLFGFSRGAYAVRSLAGVIDRIGLLRAECATERNIRQVFRLYENGADRAATRSFGRRHCHARVPIEMVGVWDTVKAIGISLPLLWRLSPVPSDFHDHGLGDSIRNGFHALAIDETRAAFQPVMWDSRPDWPGLRLEQAWFAGAHPDVGGFVGNFPAARPLANIPLVWMLERAEACGLPLPRGWRARFPCDPRAPAHGAWRGWARAFLFRRRRQMLRDPSEYIHESVFQGGRSLADLGLAKAAAGQGAITA